MEVEVILVPRYNRPLPEQFGADVKHSHRSQGAGLPSRGIELALEVVFVLRPLASEIAVTTIPARCVWKPPDIFVRSFFAMLDKPGGQFDR